MFIQSTSNIAHQPSKIGSQEPYSPKKPVTMQKIGRNYLGVPNHHPQKSNTSTPRSTIRTPKTT